MLRITIHVRLYALIIFTVTNSSVLGYLQILMLELGSMLNTKTNQRKIQIQHIKILEECKIF